MGNTPVIPSEEDIRQKTVANINEAIKSVGCDGKTPIYSKHLTFSINTGTSNARESYLSSKLDVLGEECTKETVEKTKKMTFKTDVAQGEYHFEYDFSSRIFIGIGCHCITYDRRIYSVVIRSYQN